MHPQALLIVPLLTTLLMTAAVPAHAEYIELPVLAAIGQNNLGVFEIMLMGWDRKSDPNPVQLQMNVAGVRYGLSGIPSRWLNALPGRDLVEPLVESLVSRVQ